MWRCLSWIIMLSCLVENQSRLLPPNKRSDDDFFANILSNVLQTSQVNDVVLILRDSLLDGQANDILGKIVAAITQHVPMFYVNADRTEPEFQVSSWAMSRDLVVYIYVSERGPDIVEGELVAKDTKRFIHDRVRPKVLVLMILHRPCHDLAALFRAMWSKKILDAIVVEYSKSEYSDKYSTSVHRYNPFIDSHTEEPYSADIEWFTNDFPNMQGYPLVYAFTRRPPYSDIVSTSKGQELKGIDKILSEIFADKMNFTGIPKIITKAIFFHVMPNGSQHGIMIDISSGKYDAHLVTLPMSGHFDSVQFTIIHTYPLFIENWCFVVPKLLAKQNFMVGAAIRLLLISFSIVGIFWLCSRFMKFNPDRWHSLRIVGIILTASFPPAPIKLHERIVFLSILAVSAFYSSIFFAQLASTGSESDHYVRFDHLQDLMNSNLVLMMHENILDIIKLYNNDFKYHVRESGKRILKISSTDICLKDLLMYQNVSCFMNENWAKLFTVNNMRNGETVIKTTKLCYLSAPIGYVFSAGSPYVRRVSDLFLMLASGGIHDKWHREYLRNETNITFQINQDHANFKHECRYRNEPADRPDIYAERDRAASSHIIHGVGSVFIYHYSSTSVTVCYCCALIEDNVENSRSSSALGRSVKAKSLSYLAADSTTVVLVGGSSHGVSPGSPTVFHSAVV